MGLTVTVAIAAQGDGAFAQDPAVLPAWCSLLVIVQRPHEMGPDSPLRPAQFRVIHDTETGLSRSRNRAMDEAATDLLVFLDDDMTLDMGGLAQMRAAFAADPQVALVAGWRKEHMARSKRPRKQRLTALNSGRICAPELMVRLNAVRNAGVRFDPTFGLGSAQPIGEEFIFVTDALRAGLVGLSLPVIAGSHPGPSSGDRWDDPLLVSARRAMLGRVFGPWAALARLAYGLRRRHHIGGLPGVIRFVRGT